MNLLKSAALIAAATCGFYGPLSAQTITKTISPSTGTFGTPSGFSQRWTSNDGVPVITLTASRNDFCAGPNNTGMQLHEGSAKTSTYSISVEGAWHVSGFSLTFRSNDEANPVTITSGGTSEVSAYDADKTFAVTNLSELEAAQFTLSGNNKGILTSDFTVTLEPITPEEYTEVIIDMTTGSFAENSAWKSLWQTNPGSDKRVFLAAPVLNMAAAADGKGLDLREGTANSSDYVISTAGSYRVTGFEITFTGNDPANPVTVTAAGKTLTSSDTEQTLTVDGIAYGSKAKFTLEGNNKGITTKSFKVRLSECTPTKRGVVVFPYIGFKPFSTVYRIPTLAYIPTGKHAGRILAVNDFRPCGADIGYGEVDLHTSYSEDNGLTWTDPTDPVDAQGNHVADGDGKGSPSTSNENRDCGFGDPSIVADRESGELLMMGVCGRIPIGQATRAIPQGLAIWHSTDGGDTWTMWKDITEDILGMLDNNCEYGAVDGLFFTAGRMVQSKYVKVGSHYRVYVVGGGRSDSRKDTQCWVFYTDDLGRSWHILGDPYKPALTTGGSEPKCEELPDGSIVYSGRANGGRTFNVFTYTDYATGAGRWDNAEFSRMITGAASCNGDALIVPVKNTADNSTAYLLMQSIPQHPTARVNVGINYKVLGQGYDDFGSAVAVSTNWSGSYQVTNIASAYSSLALLGDGSIGFIYEEATFGCDYSEIYRTLTVEQITHGAYTYAPDDEGATALRLTRELVAGKLAAAKEAYPERTALLAAMQSAADAFNASPTDETYLAFNQAWFDVKDNQSGIHEISGQIKSEEYYDLSGRRVLNPRRGMIYVSGGKVVRL